MIYIKSTNGLVPVGAPKLKTINGQSLLGEGDLLLNFGEGGGLSEAFGQALLDCFAHVAWTDNNGAQYYNALYQALYPIDSISVTFTPGDFIVYSDTKLEELRPYISVIAYCNGNATEIAQDQYALSGLLLVGENVITVEYFGFTATFNVIAEQSLLPEGYTKYDYIQAKQNAKGSTIAQTSFIWLPALENINTLSFEGKFGQKPNTTNGTTGIFGARPETGLGYSFYWNGTDDDPAWVYLRNVQTKLPSIQKMDYIKLNIDNPATSPYTVSINDEVVATTEWDEANDIAITTRMSLFNNIPAGNTSKMYIHWTAQIGEMKFFDAQQNCVAHYVPCTNSGNKIGMYDVIGQQFYTASTASAVTVGNSGVLYQVGNWN